MRVLVVEDDAKLAAVVRRGLAESGHVVDVESEGFSGAQAGQDLAYDVIVLDVLLPGQDGFAVARALRSAGVRTPILMLTSRDTTEDVVAGLDAGADDYLRKPFVFVELEARLRSLGRRIPASAINELRVADVVLDLATRRVTRAGRPIDLTTRDTAYLEYMMRNAGLLLTQRMIEDAVWERDSENVSNVIAVYVRRLRAKLSAAGEAPLIATVRGAGYRFGPDADA
ncbi:MAG: response regulator transcription factor [Candidatus Eremiobacteraeota bacterium]|nr:response regulator transcription factor [Candidatus Eremiobacteraeota bacterium]